MSKPYQIILASLAAVLIVTIVAWKGVAPRVTAELQGSLLSQINASMNGRITVEEIDFPAPGSAVLKNVAVFNKTDDQIATGDEVRISFPLSDLIGGRLGFSSINKISLEKVRFKFDMGKSKQWNIQDILKAQQDGSPAFHGNIVLKDIDVSVNAPNWKRDFAEIAGEWNCSGAPLIALNLTGKTSNSYFSAAGTWIPDKRSELDLKIDRLELAEVQALITIIAGEKEKPGYGTVKDTFASVMQGQTGFRLKSGSFLSGIVVKVQREKVTLQDASMVVDGNPLKVEGTIDFSAGSPEWAIQFYSAEKNRSVR